MIGNCADCKNHICAAKGISCTKVDEKQIINSYSEEEHKIMQGGGFCGSDVLQPADTA